ncbi:MAG: shikimate kinase [Candidatus Omnitrophica bacterium]|nr:shikimate kinase [Candidatus Omnitrophota bacterium]MCM8793640.1 shikimate kinase [Candidatus Omnitrophota bacterium]
MRNIVLVGFMGTGKTTVAKELAQRLKREYVSLDELIEKVEKKPITQIFAESGEDYFRALESRVIKEVSAKENLIIDAGGGAMLRRENIENFKKKGILICLKAKPEVILERTKGYKHRPLLNVSNPQKQIEKLLWIREPYYAQADHFIDTSQLSVEEIVGEILEILKKYNA